MDGSITGTTVIYNYPEDGKPETKIGRVTAVYRSGLSGRGYTEFGIPGIHVPGVKTGDDTPIRRYLLLCAASLAGIVGIAFIRRRKKNEAVCMCLNCAGYYFSGSAYATEEIMATTENSVVADDNQKVSLTGEELIIISPFIADPREYEIYLPEAQYTYENREYDLQSYEVIEAVIEEQTKCVGDTITYDAVEQIDRVPGTCEIEATDDLSGQKNTVEAPLINYEYDNYRWINDFEFPVVVEAADADTYAINNTLIPQREEAPFAGYEDLLLDLIHVDPEYYRIDSVEWDTEPWTENGVVYRKATAKGSKLVADVVAYYEGVTVFESRRGYAVRSIYSLHEDSTIEQTEEPVDPIDQEKNLSWWEFLKRLGDMIINFIRNHPVISISIGLVILIFALILILHRLSKKKKRRKK